MIDPSLDRKVPLKRSKPMKRMRQPRLKGTTLRQRPIGVAIELAGDRHPWPEEGIGQG